MAASFDWKKRLGAGHFGEVWLAVDTSLNAVRAVKLIPPSKVLNPDNLHQEAQILKSAEHPNVVRVEEAGHLEDGRIYIAMEYLPKGSLDDEAKGANVVLTRARKIMIDVLRGLEYAHDQGIFHRDIKPANILVGRSGEGKLSDFGQAVPMTFDLRTLGTKDYAYVLHLAPEVHKTQKYSVESDIYACGVTLYRLVNGDSYLPVMGSPMELRKACIQGRFPDRARYREFVPRPFKCVVNKAMLPSPTKRYRSAEEMRRKLEQLAVHMDWNEQMLPGRMRWTCSRGERCYEVVRARSPGGRWRVSVRKGRHNSSLRRVTSLCREGIPLYRAEQMTRRILQDFVLGRLR